jgi:repressor LexA
MTLHEISIELIEHGFNISKGYISQLQNGKTDRPATDDLSRALAKVTGGDIEKLLTASFLEKAPTEIKMKFIQLNNMHEGKVSTTLDSQYKEIPVYESISGKEHPHRILDTLYVDVSSIKDKEIFAFNVKGNSMLGDNIAEGDVVLCSVVKDVTYDDIVLVSITNLDTKLYRVVNQGNMSMLIPSNPKIQPILVASKDITIVGKVIELRKKYR